MLTCKQFLEELSDYLDENVDAEIRAGLEAHMMECPNCWVISDTTKKTIRIYRGLESHRIPADVESRLMAALEKKIAAKGR
ncbi:MAG TPA: zf-HC2 domain-containing protein [Bryobacteraceae bacterium]|nr:zf-HC2 domain-containing protein [Bryobacteraceae bacterium]